MLRITKNYKSFACFEENLFCNQIRSKNIAIQTLLQYLSFKIFGFYEISQHFFEVGFVVLIPANYIEKFHKLSNRFLDIFQTFSKLKNTIILYLDQSKITMPIKIQPNFPTKLQKTANFFLKPSRNFESVTTQNPALPPHVGNSGLFPVCGTTTYTFYSISIKFFQIFHRIR